MAKKPVKRSAGARPDSGGTTPPASGPEPAAPTPSAGRPEADEMAGELMVSADELDEIERRLNAGLAAVEPGERSEPVEPTDGGLLSAPTAALPAVESKRPVEDAGKATQSAVAPRKPLPPSADVEASAEPAEPASEPSTDEERESRSGTSEPASATAGVEPSAPGGGVPPSKRGAAAGFGPGEWAALAGFGVVGLVAAVLFFKFLYGHTAPIQGAGLPARFAVPMAGAQVRLVGAEAQWRPRAESDKARTEEVVLPSLALTLDPGQSSKGFLRVEFLDSDGKIRGDVMTVEIEGGRFKDGGRGEVIEDGGSKVRLVGTVGFRSRPLFTSYLASDEPRWAVRIKEGPDYSNGPWTDLGAALVPNPSLSTQPTNP